MSSSLEWWRWVLLFLFLGGLLGIWFWTQKGRLRFDDLLRRSSQRLNVQEVRWLGSRACIALVEADGERFLLAHNPGALAWQKLGNPLPAEEPVPVQSSTFDAQRKKSPS